MSSPPASPPAERRLTLALTITWLAVLAYLVSILTNIIRFFT
jgi:hypothetical protein